MKYSIKNQLVAVFVGMIGVTILFVWIVLHLKLKDYYLLQMEDDIKKAWEKLYDVEDYLSDDVIGFCEENNLSVTIASGSGEVMFTNKRDDRHSTTRVFGYMTGLEIERGDGELLEENDSYKLYKIKDRFLGVDYLSAYGKGLDDKYILIQVPLDSVSRSVDIAIRFLTIVGACVMIISAVIVWFIVGKSTKPITDLSGISRKMANLDFNARYIPRDKLHNEVDILGENFNRMSKELERTISELKTANNALKRDIEKREKLDEMRQDFLSNVSHELKTPIALIQGYAEGLKENINDDPESHEFYCDVIIDESAKMNQMVRRIMSLNQLEFGNEQVAMERFNIVELTNGILQSSALMIEQCGANVIFNEKQPLYVWGDEFKVEEVITNYFTNALNHVKDKGNIELRITNGEKNIRFSVFNEGDPIPEKDLDKIWVKFFKVDKARTRKYGGNGIGLSIVKAIMNSMNQKCGVRNFNNGVEFWFELERCE